MAAYKIADAVKLDYEVERVRGVLLVNMVAGQEYTQAEVLALLDHMGLDYSNPEYITIGQALIADGFLEVV